jgi:hypothetical protein
VTCSCCRCSSASFLNSALRRSRKAARDSVMVMELRASQLSNMVSGRSVEEWLMVLLHLSTFHVDEADGSRCRHANGSSGRLTYNRIALHVISSNYTIRTFVCLLLGHNSLYFTLLICVLLCIWFIYCQIDTALHGRQSRLYDVDVVFP